MMTVEELLDKKQEPLEEAQAQIESNSDSPLLNTEIADHDADHMKRVTVLAAYIAEHEKVRQFRQELMDAALFHDCARTHEFEDATHGADSYKRYRAEYGDNEIVEFLMAYHCQENEDAERALETFAEKDRPAVWKAYCVLRDADALDRLRLPMGDSLDPAYLHFAYSRKLIGVDRELISKYKI